MTAPTTAPELPEESPVGVIASWATILASFVLSFVTWVAVGDLAGYGMVAFALAVCIDGYIVTALVTWMAPVTDEIAVFARRNVYGAAVGGALAQGVYHGATAWDTSHSVWKTVLASGVGAAVPALTALGVHMRCLALRSTRPAWFARTVPATVHAPALAPVDAGVEIGGYVPLVDDEDPAPAALTLLPRPDPTRPAPVSDTPEGLTPDVLNRARALRESGQPAGREAMRKALRITDRQARDAIKFLNTAPVPALQSAGGAR